jgi:hypothetical protein
MVHLINRFRSSINVRRALTVLGWVMVVASVIVLGAALFFESSIYKALESAVPAGVLLALAGHFFTQSKSLADAEEKRSLFNLEGFTKAFDHAKSLLSDGNNDRAKWNEAARCLANGEELAKAVTVDEHKRVLELDRLKYRNTFHNVIHSKPAAFFYGVPWSDQTLDQAALAASKNEDGYGRNKTTRELTEMSIRMVWIASQFPDDYKEVASDAFNTEEVDSLSISYREIALFLQHKRARSSIRGELNPKRQN